MRITQKDLEIAVKRLNKLTKSPPDPYNDQGESNVGNYHIDRAYGGFALHRMVNELGGIRSSFFGGYIPKRELYGLIHAFLAGLEAE